MGPKEPRKKRVSDDPLDFYRSIVQSLIPIFLQLLRCVIDLEQVLSERRRRRLQGIDSFSSMEPWSPPDDGSQEAEGAEGAEAPEDGDEAEGEEEESLSPSPSPSPLTELPEPSPELPEPLFDDQEGEGGEGRAKRRRMDDRETDPRDDSDASKDSQTSRPEKSKPSDSKWVAGYSTLYAETWVCRIWMRLKKKMSSCQPAPDNGTDCAVQRNWNHCVWLHAVSCDRILFIIVWNCDWRLNTIHSVQTPSTVLHYQCTRTRNDQQFSNHLYNSMLSRWRKYNMIQYVL